MERVMGIEPTLVAWRHSQDQPLTDGLGPACDPGV